MADLTPYQRDILIRTALGEARGEGVEGMADIIQVVFNRANSGRYPSDPARVALQPSQFSTWNKGEGGNNPQQFGRNSDLYKQGERALDLVLSGNRPDYTGGALFYHTPRVNPNWSREVNRYGTIARNGHVFYPSHPVPKGEIPNVAATLTDVRRPAPVPVTPTPNISAYRARPNLREVPLPRSRPDVDPTSRPIAQPSGGRYEYAPNGRPRDPGNGFLMDKSDPRYPAAAAGSPNASVRASVQQQAPSVRNVPLPRPRPSNTVAPTPATMSPQIAALRARDMNLQAALDQRYGNTASVPMPRPRPVSPRDIASAPGTTIATVPTNQRTRLPDIPPPGMANVPLPRSRPVSPRDIASAPGTTIAAIPTSGIGQPPATRVVQSVPVRPVAAIDGIGSMPTFDALQAFNNRPTIPGPNGIPKGQERLAAGAFPPMPTMPGVPQIGQIQVGPPMPNMQTANVPLPIPRPLRPQVLPPIPVAAAAPGPRLTNAPLRIMVQRDPPMLTAVQRLQQQGLAPQDAYDLANLRAQQIAAAGGRYGSGAGSGGVGSYFDRVKRGENASGGSDSSLRSLVG